LYALPFFTLRNKHLFLVVYCCAMKQEETVATQESYIPFQAPSTRLEYVVVWLVWVLLCTAAWALSWSTGIVGLLLIDVVVGFFQWLVLRRYLSSIRSWVVVTGISLGLALPIGMIMFLIVSSNQSSAAGAIAGMIVGFAQRFVLHRYFANARWWTLASIIGISSGMHLGVNVFYTRLHGMENFVNNGIVGAVIGVVYGIATATMLVVLLNEDQDLHEA